MLKLDIYEFGPPANAKKYRLYLQRDANGKTLPDRLCRLDDPEVRLELTATPLRLLAMLIERWPNVQSGRMIFEEVGTEEWSGTEEEFATEYIRQIRNAFPPDERRHLIPNQRRIGYRFGWEVTGIELPSADPSPHPHYMPAAAVIGDREGPTYFYLSTSSSAAEPYLPRIGMPGPEDLDIYKLLHWESGLTTKLIGRDEKKQDLLAWAQESLGIERPRVRFLVGPGGAGKTRLAAEIARHLKDLGWTAGFIALGQKYVVPVRRKGLFLIVDYPEERRSETSMILRSLSAISEPGLPIRLLLLSRNDPADWDTELSTGHARRFVSRQPVQIGPLQSDQTQDLFLDAHRRLSTHLGREQPPPNATEIQDWIKGDPSLRALPLFIIAAAVSTLLSNQPLSALSSQAVLEALVEREVDRMRNVSRDAGMDSRSVERLSALSALAGDLLPADMRRLAEPESRLNLPQPTKILHLIDEMPWWQDSRWISPKPDVLAAVHVWTTLERDARKGHPVADWLWTVIGEGRSNRKDQASSFTWVQQTERVLYDILRVLGPGAYKKASSWLTDIVGDDRTRAEVLEPLLSITPTPRATTGLAIRVAELLSPQRSEKPDGFAQLLNRTSLQLAEDGRYPEAVAATAKAISLYESLAEKNEPHSSTGLADALNNHAIWLDNCGRTQEALAASLRAVTVYRLLVTSDARKYEPQLANGLNNLANRLISLGKAQEACDAIVESIEIRRRLCQTDPEAHEPELARSLTNLSNCVSELGRDADALNALVEAAAIRRRLAETTPWRFDPDLATTLINMSNRLGDMGRVAEALDVAREAGTIYQRLSGANASRFEPNYAHNLNNLSIRLWDNGQRQEALEVVLKAIQVYRRLAVLSPERHEINLARGLNNLSSRQSDAGASRDALASINESIDIYRRIAPSNKLAYEPELAMALNNLQSRLGDVGRHKDAVAPGFEAAAIQRRLAESNPGRYNYFLGQTLNNLSLALAAAGDEARALAVIKEAVSIRRHLRDNNPGRYDTDLAQSLNNLALRLGTLGRNEEAIDAGREGVSIRRSLTERLPDRYEPDLARALSNLSLPLEACNRLDEALQAANEACLIYRRFYTRDPVAWARRYALSLSVLARHQLKSADLEGALRSLSEATPISRHLANENMKAHGPNLVTALERQVEALSRLNIRPEENGNLVAELEAVRKAVEKSE